MNAKKIIVVVMLMFGFVGAASAGGYYGPRDSYYPGHHGRGDYYRGGPSAGQVVGGMLALALVAATVEASRPQYPQAQPVVYVERPQQQSGCYDAPQKLFDKQGQPLGERTVTVCPK